MNTHYCDGRNVQAWIFKQSGGQFSRTLREVAEAARKWGLMGIVLLVLPACAYAAQCPGPDAFGYACEDIPFDFEDISSSGSDAGIDECDDCVSGEIPLPFTFNYYGVEYDGVYISANGFLSFTEPVDGSGCDVLICEGQPIPTPDGLNNLIAGSWNDLCPGCDEHATVRYQDMGDHFIVQFTDVPNYFFEPGFELDGQPDVELVTMQYKLLQDNSIELHFAEVGNDGSPLSIGIEDSTGTDGLQFFLGLDSPPLNSAVRFAAEPPPCTLTLDLTYENGFLTLNTEVGTATPADWRFWLTQFDSTVPFFSIALPPVPSTPIPITLPFPSSAGIGVLTTISNSTDGVICGDFDLVDTGMGAVTTRMGAVATEGKDMKLLGKNALQSARDALQSVKGVNRE